MTADPKAGAPVSHKVGEIGKMKIAHESIFAIQYCKVKIRFRKNTPSRNRFYLQSKPFYMALYELRGAAWSNDNGNDQNNNINQDEEEKEYLEAALNDGAGLNEDEYEPLTAVIRAGAVSGIEMGTSRQAVFRAPIVPRGNNLLKW